MSQTFTLFLRVKEAPEADLDELVVRIHATDKPRDINWGDYINISLDKKNWVTCKLEPAGETGLGRIYINIHLRGILNRDVVGIEGAKLEVPRDFYVRKAPSWKAPFYTMHYHPNDAVRANMRLKIYGTTFAVMVTIVVALLAFMLYLTGCEEL